MVRTVLVQIVVRLKLRISCPVAVIDHRASTFASGPRLRPQGCPSLNAAVHQDLSDPTGQVFERVGSRASRGMVDRPCILRFVKSASVTRISGRPPAARLAKRGPTMVNLRTTAVCRLSAE